MDGYRKMREIFGQNNLGHIKIGMKTIFRNSMLGKVREVTSVRPLTAEEQQLEAEAKEEEAKRPPTNEVPKKGAKGAAAQQDTRVDSAASHFTNPNKDKFIPDMVSIRTGPLTTVSDLFDFWRYTATMHPENRFSYVIDD